MTAFERLREYIGRAHQKEALIGWTKRVADEQICQVLLFEAGGGLGKTRLLDGYPTLVALYCPTIRIGPIIDLYDFEHRSATAIEERLIRGLRQTSAREWYRLPPTLVDEAFADYGAASAELTRRRQRGEDAQTQAADLHRHFIRCWNKLAEQHPLVMRFDTLETLIRPAPPPEAMLIAAKDTIESDLVSGWMRLVFPQLQSTLVILSGRPTAYGSQQLLKQLEDDNFRTVEVHPIAPLHDNEEISSYLKGYGLNLDADQLAAVLRITEGRPLLLTCWAATQTVLPSRSVQLLSDRAAFEDWLVDVVLDPLAYDDDEGRTLGFCLYALSYARRGIRPTELRSLLEALHLPYDAGVVATLQELVLVKVVVDDNDDASEPLLLLHDEIYQLIDESAKPDDLGLREPTLDYLCALSERQVRVALGRTATLKAMANHMYYAMGRDLAESGYIWYAIYVQRLLRQRNIEHALILSDVFWSTMTRAVRRHNGHQVQPYLAALHASALSLEQILLDERLRYVKLLRAQEKVGYALEKADDLYRQLTEAGQLTSDRLLVVGDIAAGDNSTTSALPLSRAGLLGHLTPGSACFFADLAVSWAGLALQVKLSATQEQVSLHCSQVIAFLEGLEEPIGDSLLRWRRWMLLGTAYVTRSSVYEQRALFAEAQADVTAGLRAFVKHMAAEGGNPGDEVAIDVAQTRILLARLYALDGELDRAVALAHEVLETHAASASPYHRALYQHYYGTLLLMRGDSDQAFAALQRAEQAALEAGSKRARGFAHHGYALLDRHRLVIEQRIEQRANRNFAEAASLLQGEQGARLEVCRDWALFDVELARVYVACGNLHAAAEHRRLAAESLIENLTVTSDLSPLQHAEILAVRAHLFDGEQAQALLAEAEQLLSVPLPAQAHLIGARIALRRAELCVDGGQTVAAWQHFALALARTLVFAPRSAIQTEVLASVRRYVSQLTPDDRQAARVLLSSAPFAPQGDELGAARPDPYRWSHAWQQSCKILSPLLSE
jgi:hypothetical protein